MEILTAGMDAYDPGPDGSVDKSKAIHNYIKKSLRATRPWTRLLSVLGFIGTALIILAGIAMIVGKGFIPMSEKAPPLAFMGIFYIMASVFYLVPSIWLSKYSSAITAFLDAGDALELGKAIAYQKSFWKFVGSLALVSIAVAVLGIVAAIMIPILLSFRG
jgi:hypothetical protein